MSGYQADIDALIYAGYNFKKVGEEYKSYISPGGFEKPATGAPISDEALGNVLEIINLLHGALADAIWQHGQKLQKVAEAYQTADDQSIASLMQAAVTAATLRTDLPDFEPKIAPKKKD
ncbi:DUF6317 family protein [Actinomadura verrucosospora]|uniref:DUF6317 family protein n=1 Tax=Actinomadura verrucosospora TaxID=46165 RepID=UPI001567C642|nr:DUF6317 family protein [Actinomadura verrucosospora]